ncbi:TetR/AcrR family transcriptional regulator [Cryptosporangium phraense]|uniref:TetR/AcrR family transcriptional regulator n=1 Tax=Cryptosporangium phraense TaxID=2593070 RepID=A0A545AE72_9ACTN|nr:TetR/AcrR family transcriptional regulator [Cryptosporangium phraense]TQS39622.1 TetR/AcrR family transcriptional regulator [Cryptosporangium phraense]
MNPEILTRAGADLADEVGFDRVTVSELARRFEVPVANLYSHVKNSADLKARITLLALEELADRIEVALAGRAGRDALVAVGDVYRSYAREHPGRWSAAQRDLAPAAAAESAGPRITRMTRAILRGYELEEPDQTHAVRLLGSVFNGYVNLEAAGAYAHSSPSPDASWTWILGMLDSSLRAWSPQPQEERTSD